MPAPPKEVATMLYCTTLKGKSINSLTHLGPKILHTVSTFYCQRFQIKAILKCKHHAALYYYYRDTQDAAHGVNNSSKRKVQPQQFKLCATTTTKKKIEKKGANSRIRA